jgi:hypothetical protein
MSDNSLQYALLIFSCGQDASTHNEFAIADISHNEFAMLMLCCQQQVSDGSSPQAGLLFKMHMHSNNMAR